MKALGVLLVLPLLVATISCQTQKLVYPDVDYDYNVATDFSEIKTYAWRSGSGDSKIDKLNIERVRKAVNANLQSKGMEQSPHDPDFYIVLYGGTHNEYTLRWRGWDDNLMYSEGRIKLAFFSPRLNKMIWWGETRADVFFYMEPEEKDKIIGDAVTRILATYPPP
jgi:hypothetical protein